MCLYMYMYVCYVQESKDKHVVELTRQVSLLKNQLDRTAETQKDFVELSQSLQVSSSIIVMYSSDVLMYDSTSYNYCSYWAPRSLPVKLQ